MTDSVKIERPPHDPIASTLSAADDRIVLSEWLPPQEGIVPRIRVGQRWISILWALSQVNEHRMMLRRRDRNDQRLLKARLDIETCPPRLR